MVSIKDRSVKELRKLAKQRGIKPIPSRKADLVAAIEAPEDSRHYTMGELKTLCKKNQGVLTIPCAGKGVTRSYLLEHLTKAGIIGSKEVPATGTPSGGTESGPESGTGGMSHFERLIKEAEPGLHTTMMPMMPHIPKLGFLLGAKIGSKYGTLAAGDPWKFVYSEYALLENSIAAGSPEWQDVLDVIQGRPGNSGEVQKNVFEDVTAAAPLISYGYAVLNPLLRDLMSELQSKQMFKISDALTGTDLAIFPESDTVSGAEDILPEDPFSLLPSEMLYEILRHLPEKDERSSMAVAKSFVAAEREHRAIESTYGEYVLSRDQISALSWFHRNTVDTAVLILKAPPSWGKTAFMIATAIDAVRDGQMVVMHTTGSMVPFFLEEMKRMMGKQFPDLSHPEVAQDGKIRVLVPSYSPNHRKAFNEGTRVDILLVVGPQQAKKRHEATVGGLPVPPHPITKYKASLVIVDEAHKGDVRVTIGDHLRRGDKDTRFLLLSASELDVDIWSSDGGPKTLAFSSKSVESRVPGFTLEIRSGTNRNYTTTMLSGFQPRLTIFETALIIEDLQKTLKGNTIVFVERLVPVWMSKKKVKAQSKLLELRVNSKVVNFEETYNKLVFDKKSLIWHRTARDIARFQEQSKSEPSVLVITYKRGAEGLNLNTADNVILLNANRVGRKTIYQAIARAQRVSNPRHTISVIAIVEEGIISQIGVAIMSVGEDFMDALRRTFFGATARNAKVRPSKVTNNRNMYYYLKQNRKRMSNEEIYLIFSQVPLTLKDGADKRLKTLIETRNLFPGFSPDMVVGMLGNGFLNSKKEIRLYAKSLGNPVFTLEEFRYINVL